MSSLATKIASVMLAAIFALFAPLAQAATLLPQGEVQFLDNNGAPLSGGFVYFYVPATTVPKNTYRDSGATVLNTNPIVLDSAGRAIIYGAGAYQEAVFDNLNNLIWSQLTADTSAGSASYGGTSGGSGNVQTVAAGSFTAQAGQTITFLAGFTNSAGLTITPSGGSPIAVLKDLPTGPTALTGGEVVAGNSVTVVYDPTRGAFHLVSMTPQYSVPGNYSVGGNLSVAGTLSVGGTSAMASVNLTNLSATGNISAGGTLGVTGNASFTSASVSGTATIGTSSVTNNESVGGNLAVTGNGTVGGTLGVTGTSTLGVVNAGVTGLGATTVTGNLLVSGLTKLGGATTAAPYNVSGTLVVPTGVPIRATNVVSARCNVTSGTASIANGFNCSTLTTSGAGQYTVSFTNSLANTDYQVILGLGNGGCVAFNNKTTSSVGFVTANCSTGTGTNFGGTVDVVVTGGN